MILFTLSNYQLQSIIYMKTALTLHDYETDTTNMTIKIYLKYNIKMLRIYIIKKYNQGVTSPLYHNIDNVKWQ